MLGVLCLVPGMLLADTPPAPGELPPTPVQAVSSPPPVKLGLPSADPAVPTAEAQEGGGVELDEPPVTTELEHETAPPVPSIYSRPLLAERGSLSFVLGTGPGRFNMVDWESRPNADRLWWLGRWSSPEPTQLYAEVGFNIHWWAGPVTKPGINLPPRVYDLYLDSTWAQKWSDRLATEVRVQPGLYTDFRTTPPDAFRIPGQAVAVYQACPDFFVVGGVQHLQRNEIKVLPIAGVLWQPSEAWELRLLFPEPKIAFEMSSTHQVWGYVTAEYGGGRWTYKNDAGHSERVEYSDDRVAFGIEWREECLTKLPFSTPKASAFLEVAYLFDRHLRFTGPQSDFGPKPAWMIRFGHSW